MITYNDFERYLTKIQKIHELGDEITKLENKYDRISLGYMSLFPCYASIMEDELIDCLEKGLNLKPNEFGYSWVRYWIWETDCGQRNTIVEIDNKEVNIAEIANLWKVIEWEIQNNWNTFVDKFNAIPSVSHFYAEKMEKVNLAHNKKPEEYDPFYKESASNE